MSRSAIRNIARLVPELAPLCAPALAEEAHSNEDDRRDAVTNLRHARGDQGKGIKERRPIAVVCLITDELCRCWRLGGGKGAGVFAGVVLPVTLGRRAFAADPSFLPADCTTASQHRRSRGQGSSVEPPALPRVGLRRRNVCVSLAPLRRGFFQDAPYRRHCSPFSATMYLPSRGRPDLSGSHEVTLGKHHGDGGNTMFS